MLFECFIEFIVRNLMTEKKNLAQIPLLPSEQFHFLLLSVFVLLEYVSCIVAHCGQNVYVDINVPVDIKPEVRPRFSFLVHTSRCV